VPYDCGLAFVRDSHALQAAMAITAEYLPTETEFRNPGDFTPGTRGCWFIILQNTPSGAFQVFELSRV
jgi:hypothetical protein